MKRHFLRWGGGPAQKQYFGRRAHGGGALCVLERPLGAAPGVTNLLADSVCQRGRINVPLSDGELHRIALWIDTNCRFFGATRHLMAQAMGERVVPEPE